MSGGSFLDRWSQRKALDRRADPSQRPEDDETEAPTPGDPFLPDEPPPVSEAELAALPRIETLTAESDLRPFLRPGVPAPLRNAAMRKMWLLTPAIRDHVDCAVDYAWDWNTPGGVPGDGGILTADSIRKMAQALKAPRPAIRETEPVADQPGAPPAQSDTGERDPHKTAAPEPQGQATGQSDDPKGRETGAAQPAPDRSRRRHGGAMPS
ncbi:MAG: Protein of unknown function (DUF3306) [Rhodobacteraceae bacterium HLUCCA12]|nr:MAG: Protein of unknown function (DUF3306) [Rhodobacteraceae bacterium HLUCCA12]